MYIVRDIDALHLHYKFIYKINYIHKIIKK